MRRSQRILEKLIKLETLLIVQDPKGPLSADAYDGLRKSVVHATQARRHHVSHLVSLRDSLDRKASQELISDRVNEFLNELGVLWVEDPTHADLFTFESNPKDGELGEWVCTKPAVVSRAENGDLMLHRQGAARWEAADTKDLSKPDEAAMESPDTAEASHEEESTSTDASSEQDAEA